MDLRAVVSADDEARAVKVVRILNRNPALATQWARPTDRMLFVIATLLGLPVCCPGHLHQTGRLLRRFLPPDVDHTDGEIRRRALEILTAVAMADGLPRVHAPVPRTSGTS